MSSPSRPEDGAESQEHEQGPQYLTQEQEQAFFNKVVDELTYLTRGKIADDVGISRAMFSSMTGTGKTPRLRPGPARFAILRNICNSHGERLLAFSKALDDLLPMIKPAVAGGQKSHRLTLLK